MASVHEIPRSDTLRLLPELMLPRWPSAGMSAALTRGANGGGLEHE